MCTCLYPRVRTCAWSCDAITCTRAHKDTQPGISELNSLRGEFRSSVCLARLVETMEIKRNISSRTIPPRELGSKRVRAGAHCFQLSAFRRISISYRRVHRVNWSSPRRAPRSLVSQNIDARSGRKRCFPGRRYLTGVGRRSAIDRWACRAIIIQAKPERTSSRANESDRALRHTAVPCSYSRDK